MKQTHVLSLTDNTPFVTLNVEQFREVVRQEVLIGYQQHRYVT